VAAIPLVLTDHRSGARRHFASFSDGTFYLMGVKAGDYELAAEDGAMTGTVRFTLTPEAAAAGRAGLELVLTSR
jgi:hypothetical protein